MSGKERNEPFDFTGEDLANFLDSALRHGNLENLGNSKRPEQPNSAHQPLRNPSFEPKASKPEYKLSDYEKHTISQYNERLIDKIKYIHPFVSLTEELTLESTPTHVRLHTEKSRAYTTSDHPAEFLYYPQRLPRELEEVFGDSVQSILVVGIFTDPQTRPKYQPTSRDKIMGYHPQTWYGIRMQGIDRNNLELTKVSSIPHSFNDPRPNLFPQRPDAHYVRSQLISDDGYVVPRVLSHMISQF